MRHTQEKSNEIPKKIGSDIIPTQKGILTDFWKRANRVFVSVVVGVTRKAGNETSLLFSSVRFEIHSLVWRVCVSTVCYVAFVMLLFWQRMCSSTKKGFSPSLNFLLFVLLASFSSSLCLLFVRLRFF